MSLHLLLALAPRLDNDDICIIGALRMLLLCYTWPSRTGELPEMENLFATTLLLLHYGLLLKQTEKEAPQQRADIRILSGFRVIDVSHLKYPFGRGPIFLRLTIRVYF